MRCATLSMVTLVAACNQAPEAPEVGVSPAVPTSIDDLVGSIEGSGPTPMAIRCATTHLVPGWQRRPD